MESASFTNGIARVFNCKSIINELGSIQSAGLQILTSQHTLPSISTYFAKYPDILCQVSRHTEMSSQMAVCEKKKEGGRFLFSLPLVTRLGLEPKTPTLKV